MEWARWNAHDGMHSMEWARWKRLDGKTLDGMGSMATMECARRNPQKICTIILHNEIPSHNSYDGYDSCSSFDSYDTYNGYNGYNDYNGYNGYDGYDGHRTMKST